jgi:hypothetical protein
LGNLNPDVNCTISSFQAKTSNNLWKDTDELIDSKIKENAGKFFTYPISKQHMMDYYGDVTFSNIPSKEWTETTNRKSYQKNNIDIYLS